MYKKKRCRVERKDHSGTDSLDTASLSILNLFSNAGEN